MKKNIESIAGCKCPDRCFCKYNANDIVNIAYQKFILKIPTVDLIHAAHSEKDKEYISVVAMLELDSSVAEIMIKEHMSDSSCDVLACRDALRRRLDDALREYPPDAENQ